ncbi:MAG TPA: precorrin-6y C5,15-methyltransferase (decarboxylating) subunit CbiE [Peptococcaceae bacterium]|nr:MAG: Precorrin-6Y C5,15-methyltransferase (Decarboxylating) [Moorella sp. 60_41]HBT47334.1 precorrin-6y C5,15-methyltransferase (decarboxylating) subunit CbiE [Peptococcaceae bacterium]
MQGKRKTWLTVVGVGPGDPKWLVPAAYEAVAGAEILVGGSRALELFRFLDKERRVIDADLEGLYRYLTSVAGRPTAVLVSGDPGLYSLLPWLKERFAAEEIRVVPGISSVQLAFARLGCSWEGASIMSVHGRPLNSLDPYLERLARREILLAVLTGGQNTPAAVGGYMEGKGLGDTVLWVGSQLGGAAEKTALLTAKELARADFGGAAVIIGGFSH